MAALHCDTHPKGDPDCSFGIAAHPDDWDAAADLLEEHIDAEHDQAARRLRRADWLFDAGHAFGSCPASSTLELADVRVQALGSIAQIAPDADPDEQLELVIAFAYGFKAAVGN